MPCTSSIFLLFYGTAVLSYFSPIFRKASNAILSNIFFVAVHVYVFLEMIVYFALRLSIKLLELLLFPLAEPRQQRRMRQCMLAARNYDEWLLYAKALDKLQGRSTQDYPETHHNTHNWTHMEELIQSFRQARKSDDVLLAAVLVQQCAKRNVEGVLDESLYAKTHTGEPPAKVSELIEEIATTMEWLTDIATRSINNNKQSKPSSNTTGTDANIVEAYQSIMSMATLQSVNNAAQGDSNNSDDGARQERSSSMTLIQHQVAGNNIGPALLAEEMKRSLHRLRVSYGRTALCLSGGAALTYLHGGHLLGLLETNCMPNILSGSSAGAVFAAAICSKTDQELIEYLQPTTLCRTLNPFGKPWIQRFMDLWKWGHMNFSQECRRVIKAYVAL